MQPASAATKTSKSATHGKFDWADPFLLADQLTDRGHVTLSDGQSHWWGRCCSGQAIKLDGILQRIVATSMVASGCRNQNIVGPC